MAPFALVYARWKVRMVRNLVTEKREYMALAVGVTLLGLVGLSALWIHGSAAMADLLQHHAPRDMYRVLGLLAFSLYVALSFMALANVVTRFFGQQRMDEREHLLGPVGPIALFATELLDTLKFPFLVLLAGAIGPLALAFLLADLPPWLFLLLTLDLLALAAQPTLVAMALYIGVIRFLPVRATRSRFLLFGFFVLLAGLGVGALGNIRAALRSGAAVPLTLPPSWVAAVVPFYSSGDTPAALDLSVRTAALTVVLGAIAFLLYRFSFLDNLELFGSHSLGSGKTGGHGKEQTRTERWVLRRLPQEMAAIVLKDLRSSQRDTAQRVAFTAMGAVMFSLVAVDLVTGEYNAALFIPILAAYALFLVSCQGLSTFSAEGGLLENLAQLPLDANRIFRAKVVGHTLLFTRIFWQTLVLLVIAPSPLPLPFRLFAAICLLPVLLAASATLGWLTVALGAIFPKPGQGGRRKEISIVAMGLYLEFVILLTLSGTGACAAALGFRGVFWLLVPLVALVWTMVFLFLNRVALRAVERALGAEFRAG